MAETRTDLLWLLGLASLLIATGIGLRDPWPADEPRFVLIARDMVATGQWLLPTVGGELYADKPPLYFWLIAAACSAAGSLRIAFLLPSLLAGLATVALVYDLARRLWNRETGLIAATALLLTVQFVWQARQAQIDATLCCWTTLSLYGLLRHLLLGPQWRWYAIGWAAAGLGVITKGVGFLPLLLMVPFVLLRSDSWQPRAYGPARMWLTGPLAFAVAVSLWLVPMLLAARADPAVAAYRDEILFQQTIERYASAWHHREPFWYYIVEVIPWLWLPLTALLPWLVPAWRERLRRRDLRIALLLSWIGLVVLFFSLSPGKRGVYMLPALPALALAAAPCVPRLLARPGVQRVLFTVAAGTAAICVAGVAYLYFAAHARVHAVMVYGLDALAPLALIAALGTATIALARPKRGLMAYGGVLIAGLLVVSYWVNPAMNRARSGQSLVAAIERMADPSRKLGIVAFKEQYLLNIRRPIVHFGHARWREAGQEAADAARWLSENPGSQLVVSESVRAQCLPLASARSLGTASRTHWYLVEGMPAPECAARGKSGAARAYTPPPGTS